ncbi:alpha/beta-Hydrolases superfamily protein [Striga asiatica]|uniref:Alpha/beta-Hydrolases superfamily protein n=1 Tax=Striga asiatica TaxID=4170 RepID=A0A5A7Q6H7_STRAF|nr:alpha/beta-Hydrolases superfamily protein [Striga asiatica]
MGRRLLPTPYRKPSTGHDQHPLRDVKWRSSDLYGQVFFHMAVDVGRRFGFDSSFCFIWPSLLPLNVVGGYPRLQSSRRATVPASHGQSISVVAVDFGLRCVDEKSLRKKGNNLGFWSLCAKEE